MPHRALPWRAAALVAGSLALAGWAAPPLPAGFWPAPAPTPPGYAQRVFAGLLPFDAVLAERERHPWWELDWDCTYAVVGLTDGALPAPPSRPREEVPWWLAFGGGWEATPMPPVGDTTRDALAFCGRYWDDDVNLRLAAATAQAGSWYVRDDVGETVFVYSLPQRLAARVRFGD